MATIPTKKLLSIFLFLIITLTISFTLRAETPETSQKISLSLSDLAVPEELGKVQERFAGHPKEMAGLVDSQAGSTPRTIIQIQDVHANATAQQNIAAILERLRVVFGIEKAALEGAWSSTSLPKSHAIPTSREKQLLAGTLLDDDRISGPVYAAIMSPEPITLIGVEDEASYEKNRALFLTHLGKAKEIDEKLRLYGASLQETQKSTWGPELLTFGNAFGKFRETSDLGKFFPVLWNAAETQSVDLSDLTQITLVRDIMSLEKSFEKKRLEQEVKHLMREYKNTPWTLEELIRGGKIPPEKLGFYPEIKKMTHLYQLRDQISLRDLTTQIETLTGRILEKLARLPKETALWEKSERFYFARRILLLQASPADIKAYESEKLLLGSELAGAGLSEALSLSLDFYAVVKKRDEIFFNKIVNDPSLSGNVAIVTGGFHTDGLSQLFRDAGISYITITPELGGTAMNEKLYAERMNDVREAGNEKRITDALHVDRSPMSAPADAQTLSELRNAPVRAELRFPLSYEVLRRTRNLATALSAYLEEEIAVPKSDQISDLSREGRLRRHGGPDTVDISAFQESEFLALPRSEQVEIFQKWLKAGEKSRQRSMLVSSVSALKEMLASAGTEMRIKALTARGDLLALLQDLPPDETPVALLSAHGIEKFQAPDLDALQKTTSFLNLTRQRPSVFMKNGYRSENRVVVDEDPVWLELFPILTLNARLYKSAQNPAFLELLKSLYTEILSRELPKKAV